MTGIRQWLAPAKLNLMLHITGRRADGYHELQTVFQFLDFCDRLEFIPDDTGEIKRLGGDYVDESSDLVVRAAKLLQQTAGTPKGVSIRVNKQLPMGAGLGGGSSDAATTLHALNVLWQLELEVEQLAQLGLELGADIPVFIHGYAAFAEGVGERLTPLVLDEPWFLVIIPDEHVSTAEIFRDQELTRDCPTIKICDLSAAPWKNVCEPVVASRYPGVKKALETLSIYAEARMSGTGSAVFAAFGTKDEAENAYARLCEDGLDKSWLCTIARGMNTSPLIDQLNSST